MEKKTMLFIGVFLIAMSALAMALSGATFTGKSISDIKGSYTYTKAICNAENECIDVLVLCENGNLKSLEPVSDLVKFSDGWEDLRADAEFC